jgi:hypothetical protein
MEMNTVQAEKRIYTIKEAARFYGLPEFALRNWCKTGDLNHLKAGTRVYLTPAAIEELLAKGGAKNEKR